MGLMAATFIHATSQVTDVKDAATLASVMLLSYVLSDLGTGERGPSAQLVPGEGIPARGIRAKRVTSPQVHAARTATRLCGRSVDDGGDEGDVSDSKRHPCQACRNPSTLGLCVPSRFTWGAGGQRMPVRARECVSGMLALHCWRGTMAHRSTTITPSRLLPSTLV